MLYDWNSDLAREQAQIRAREKGLVRERGELDGLIARVGVVVGWFGEESSAVQCISEDKAQYD